MPNRNHTGPQGAGPGTGRGMGTCGRTVLPPEDLTQGEASNNGRGMGRGRRRRHGQGNGRCGRPHALDQTPQNEHAQLSCAKLPPATPEGSIDETRDELERQVRWLREQLDVLEERLSRAARRT